jgi:ADP-ribose pyrophosphatase YjhB (NUDIX family)
MIKDEKFKPYVAVWLVAKKDEQILLLRRYNTGYMDGHYTLVAGHLEADEGVTSAMIREAKEEAGLSLTREQLSVAHITHRKCPDREYLDFFFVARDFKDEPSNMEPDKCDDMQWFSMNELPTNILPNLKFALDAIKNKTYYGEFGW